MTSCARCCFAVQNAYFALIPVMGTWIFILLSGMWSDQLRSRGALKTTATRRIMNSIGKCVIVQLMTSRGALKTTATRRIMNSIGKCVVLQLMTSR